MINRTSLPLAIAVLTAAIVSCAGPASRATVEHGAIDDRPGPGGVILSAQPTRSDLEQARKDGVRTVINLRHEREDAGFDERAVVTQLGMRYENPGFGGPDEMTDDILARTRELLSNAERPILLHCASANRVGAVWAVHLALDEGRPWDEAVAEAKAAGLRSPALETRAREYVAAQRGSAPPGATTKPAPPAAAAPGLDERERAFRAMLTGAELIGHFTLDGAGDDAPLREERYSIASVTKVRGNLWRFDCRIRYDDNDVAIPLTLPVAWAGNTPVIGVTDLDVPGLGTYTARVLLFRDKYAGTWSGRNHGGHLFGRIERPAEGPGGGR